MLFRSLNGYRESIANLEMVISNAGGAQVNIGDGGNLIFQAGANNAIVVFSLDSSATTGARIDGGVLSLNYPVQGTINRSVIVADTAAAEDLVITSSIRDNSGLGVANLYKYGYGTLELGGPSANTYSGLTRVYEGTIVLNKEPGKDALSGPLTVGDDSLYGGGRASDAVRWKNSEQLPDLYAPIIVYGTGVLDLAGHNETVEIGRAHV